MRRYLITLTVGVFALCAPAEQPTTRPTFQLNADIGGQANGVKAVPDDPLKLRAFDLNVRPLNIRPLDIQPFPAGSPRPEAKNVESWSTFNYNGQTVINRPAVMHHSYAVIKDLSTGNYIFYRDFASTVKVPSNLREQP